MTEFKHQHTAHCESGVVSTLLQHHGIELNEAMVFGLANALTFVYIPIIKLAGMPLISYRMPPKSIIKNICKTLNIQLKIQTFSSPEKGMQTLDQALEQNKLVGLQTSVYWLPYFPQQMRFHFNAHNLLVYGKEQDHYLVSDPVFETVQRCSSKDLEKARFTKGVLAPNGLMYYINQAPTFDSINQKLPQLIKKAIHQNAKRMLAPIFFIGTKGMHTVAKTIQRLPEKKVSNAYRKLYLGHIVRMQEEIGTGGAGFRYLYAYFLEQAAQYCQEPAFQAASQELTTIGDLWRHFASQCVQQCKQLNPESYQTLAKQLHHIAERETTLWQSLKK